MILQPRQTDMNGNLTTPGTFVNIEFSSTETSKPSDGSEDANESFYLIWINLSYSYTSKVVNNRLTSWKKEVNVQQVLKPMNGKLKSGSLIAIMLTVHSLIHLHFIN